ncbi:amidase domain-containing protein [Paenibacillus polymyxa]|uniref:amidase domain-containing protein n=1 Tax=Paenibacillus polymyxa TaxID=1406 RepID=UPI001BE87B2F|nr:amidase domain-containing protein [Paenibacillus polymyxa]MBT2286508.1 amidase domain-containing protein [Paenibacillus polymyxa]
MKKKKIVILLAGATLVFNGMSAYANEDISTTQTQYVEKYESITVNIEQNPYIELYKKEKEQTLAQHNFVNRDELVDPLEEERVILQTLDSYFKQDIKVAEILHKNLNQDVYEKTISLKKEDKIEVMHLIEDSYSIAADSEEQEILMGYLTRYSRSSGDERAENFKNRLTTAEKSAPEFQLLAAYNSAAAGNWAYNNYNKYSTNYPAFTAWGSDCTNFVSQAMHVGGGKPMSGNWSAYKKNSTYLVPKNATELNYSWTFSDPSPWISVEQFSKYWIPKSTVYSYSKDNYEKNHKSIYLGSIAKGDVVIFSKGVAGWITTPTHLMIISDLDGLNRDFKLAGHSNERQAYPLLSAIKSYDYIEILKIP